MTSFPIKPELDHDYNARESVESFDDEFGKLLTLSETARTTLPYQKDVVFDPQIGMGLDLYGIGPNRPVFLWIHGGYWRMGSKEGNAFAAPGLVEREITVAVMDYGLVPDVTLYDIVHQVRLAVAWLKREGPAMGLDTRHIHIGGSSAGGHLVGAVLAGGWHAEYGLALDTVGAALALSGVFDLEPLLYTRVNGWMDMDMATVADLSPIRHLPTETDATLILSVGGLEREGFHRETADYGAAWTNLGHKLTTVEMPGYNHFDITGTLSDPNSVLVDHTLKTIQSYHR